MAVNYRTLGMTSKTTARFVGFGTGIFIALATFIVLYFFSRSSSVALKALTTAAMLYAIAFVIQIIRLIRLNKRDP
ncbi:hypothetical protein [Burkholderia sp. S171]|uniref:hypothetical protein n=1 Tax=Burkholderia sp. S171 TaxID=1641860 RepID=UPI00131BDA06|nr:hypothetical protein [Burkholderia sp. S171]